MDGVLVLIKPINFTSRDLVNKMSKKFNERKAGHTGTLDPFATGLMLLTFGKATKISTYLEATEKTYIAELTLGIATDTLDTEGKIIEEKEVILPSREELDKIFNSFVGEIEQIPPMHSAIKVNGEKLYDIARRGEVIERKARKVTIFYNKILSITDNKIIFEVKCSKGTYIRTLGKDIADAIGCGGHLSNLTRTRIGDFTLKDAKTIDEVKEEDLISIGKALSFFPSIKVDEKIEKKVRNGVKIYINSSQEKLLIKSFKDEPLAIYEKRDDGYYYSLRGLF